MHYVIVGNSAAGIGAAEAIRKVDVNGNITIVGEEPHHAYSRPLIAHYLAGEVEREEMLYRPEDFYERHGIEAKFGKRATRLDVEAKELMLSDGEVLHYDKLLIATGSIPRFPKIKGSDLEGVYDFWTLDDAEKVRERAMGAKSAVVVGGGLIGLQAAFALQAFGLKVTVVEILDRILGRILDAEGADIVRRIVEEGGIRILTGCSVAEIFGTKGEGVKGVILEEGGEISCSLVIKATGVVPNIELVRGTKVEVSRGILVNERLETSVPSIYAAGDVAETFDIARGYRFVNANWPNAHEQGRIAGLNMAGKRTTYPGSIGMNSIVAYGVPIISMGLIEDRQGVKIRRNPEAHIYQKLVFEGDRLIGAILIGDISNTGLINDLIRNRTPVGIIKDAILENKAQLFHFRRALRREEVEGVGIEWKESLSTKEVYRKKFDDRRWEERARCRLGETPCKRE